MKIKVSEAAGPVLDYMVATAEEVEVRWSAAHEQLLRVGYHYAMWQPHKNWAQGGPIIEREKISTECKHDGWWAASYQYNYSDTKEHLMLGDTALIAAMRCYVASKLGAEVDVNEGNDE